jgi:hypothetical protein
MTRIQNYDDLKKWVRGEENRSVTIELGELYNNKLEKIWVYDFSLLEGQHVSIPGEITLYDTFEEKTLQKVKALQNKLNEFKKGKEAKVE